MWIVKVLEINNSGEGGGGRNKIEGGGGRGVESCSKKILRLWLKGFSKINREEGDYSVL